VFDPVEFDIGDEVRVRFDGNDPGDIEGKAQGTGLENVPLAPYLDRLADYQAFAADALDDPTIPRTLRNVIEHYFTSLEP
jgi:hypothetical protein